MTTYELKIGYFLKSSPEKSTFVYREYFSSGSLNGAKMRATTLMKGLESMQKYVIGKKGNKIKWEVWSKKRERKTGLWNTSKFSVPNDNSRTVGFCELSWDKLQISLFDELPVSA